MDKFNAIAFHEVNEVVISPTRTTAGKNGDFTMQRITIDGEFEIDIYYRNDSNALITLEQDCE